MKILITGIAGALGRQVAQELVHEGHELMGIDRRPWPDAPKGVQILRGDIRKRPAEDLFRTQKPDVVIHMATVSHFSTPFEERARINLYGTRRIFEHCHRYGVKHALFVGRHTVYGAAPDTPLYHTEDDPPMGGATFPELADLVGADLYAASSMWRHPQMKAAVLRVVYVLGPSRQGTLAQFLKGSRVPMVMGYDPLFQFMHEQDAAAAICAAVKARLHGVFNVAGPAPVPLSLLCQVTGRRPLALPGPVLGRVLGRMGLPKLPKGAISHLKFPVVVDDKAFRKATGFEATFDETRTMEAFRYPAR